MSIKALGKVSGTVGRSFNGRIRTPICIAYFRHEMEASWVGRWEIQAMNLSGNAGSTPALSILIGGIKNMKVKRFERIESLSKFLERETEGEISVKRVTIVPHTPEIFYVFYDEGKNCEQITSKIIDFRNFLVREEKTLDDIIRGIEQERIYWQTADNPSSKRVLDYLSYLKDQLAMSAVAVNEMMREAKELLMRRY